MKKNIKESFAYIHFWLFLLILVGGGVLFFAMPSTDESELENRKLAPFPTLTIDNFTSGKYFDSIDAHFSDHFPFRELFVLWGQKIKNNRGFWLGKTVYIAPTADEVVTNADTCIALLNDTVNFDTIPFDPKKLGSSKGLTIYDGMAFQIFGGNKRVAAAYASMVNKYRENLDPSINIFCLIIPSNAEFYKPKDMKLGASESKNIRDIYSFLNKGITPVYATENIRKHTDEYIYFNTDHHWTGLGAYYAYQAFCEAAKIKPIPLTDLDRKCNGKYLGSLYRMTLDERLKERGDSVVVYRIRNKYKAYSMDSELKKSTHAFLYYRNACNYGVFLGGDLPIMRIDSDNKNGRKLLIIKNSFGNALAPYMVPHFEQVFIMDYRYFRGSVEKLVKQFNVTDILFPTSIFAANTVSHIGKMRSIFNGRKSINKDSIKTK